MMRFMTVFWIVFAGSIAWLLTGQRRGRRPKTDEETALDILNKRYASDQIDKEEYERRKRDISGD